MIKVALLCGGSGTRLWPLSRETYPKQFIKIFNNLSLFQQTLKRHYDLGSIEIISNERFFFTIQNEAHQTSAKIDTFILESISKNTAPAIAFSALNSNPEDIILVASCDHLISPHNIYKSQVQDAIELAKKDKIITFGVHPKSANTGYGYINPKTCTFTEKPDSKTAQKYIENGYLWNSGIFCFKASVILEELEKFEPKMLLECKKIFENSKNNKQDGVLTLENMDNLIDKSIDFAVMEKSQRVACIKAKFNWDDVGSFDSLCENISTSAKEVSVDSKNNFIYSEKLVATIGIEDLCIIDTPDSLLVAKKGSTQRVKDLLPQVKALNPELTAHHSTTHRPWGSYSVLLEFNNYKIKKILVKPGGRLSLQKHAHRSEHWVVVSGVAQVTIDSEVFLLHRNESTFIPIGKAHRLENTGKIDLVIIEVQLGEYLGEDDIVRIEDIYNRK